MMCNLGDPMSLRHPVSEYHPFTPTQISWSWSDNTLQQAATPCNTLQNFPPSERLNRFMSIRSYTIHCNTNINAHCNAMQSRSDICARFLFFSPSHPPHLAPPSFPLLIAPLFHALSLSLSLSLFISLSLSRSFSRSLSFSLALSLSSSIARSSTSFLPDSLLSFPPPSLLPPFLPLALSLSLSLSLPPSLPPTLHLSCFLLFYLAFTLSRSFGIGTQWLTHSLFSVFFPPCIPSETPTPKKHTHTHRTHSRLLLLFLSPALSDFLTLSLAVSLTHIHAFFSSLCCWHDTEYLIRWLNHLSSLLLLLVYIIDHHDSTKTGIHTHAPTHTHTHTSIKRNTHSFSLFLFLSLSLLVWIMMMTIINVG